MDLDETLDEFGDRGMVIVPFFDSHWLGISPAEALNECKKRGWVETRIKKNGMTYIGWKHGTN